MWEGEADEINRIMRQGIYGDYHDRWYGVHDLDVDEKRRKECSGSLLKLFGVGRKLVVDIFEFSTLTILL
ncbi:hypothetical protein GQ457_06G043950 [Hibiscus cannabinus]